MSGLIFNNSQNISEDEDIGIKVKMSQHSAQPIRSEPLKSNFSTLQSLLPSHQPKAPKKAANFSKIDFQSDFIEFGDNE